MDEYVRMAEKAALENLKRFCVAVVDSLGDEYLRAPTTQDLSRLLRIKENRGFPKMLGSLDCMHWRWKNYPKGCAGHFTGKEKAPTIIPGSHNDINVLDRSHLFTDLTDGKAPSLSYQMNGTHYSMGYYLADGIYPPWATLVQTISNPQSKEKKFFAEAQESARKDVERAFGMLQSQCAILTRPCRLWSQEDMEYIVKACVILRHMAIENKRDPDGIILERSVQDSITSSSTVVTAPNLSTDRAFTSFIGRYKAIRSSELHYQLRNNLIEHLWARSGNKNAQ
uniref:Ribosomal proteinlike putative n=1 Tax=Albugo laibachii Nc14 TaxID=890382 RepID=F0WN51_9STRA|nr:ribosomal proteinlike putative [Albugo laibachii Nc14]|eukprot:CCA22740.1 ribosomal proteinlike putative [Albugo laibachii Nc14]